MKKFSQHIFEIELSDFDKELQDPEVKKGYDAFIKSLEAGGDGNSDPGDSGDKSGNDQNGDEVGDASDERASSGSGSGRKDDKQDQQGSGGGSGSGDGEGDPDMGTVTPDDMGGGGSSTANCPSTPGGMIKKEDGDKIAEQEGYKKEGGTDSQVEKTWNDNAKRAAEAMKNKGLGAGYDSFVKKITNLNHSSKDWKTELIKVVGRSINPIDKRRAFVAKNPLVTQNRLVRTDKDKFDAVSYIMCWIDTSGSMSESYLNACIREVYQVALQKKPMSIVIVQFDTRVADIQIFNSLADLKKKLNKFVIKGGGGTDCKCCFDLFKEDKRFKNTNAELVMIFTDGYLDQYKRPVNNINHLCWVICDNPSWELKYRDAFTMRVYISKNDFKE